MFVNDGSIEVQYYEIVIKHDDEGNIAGYIQFESCGTVHRSNIYSIPELNGILVAWRHNELKGSFAAGYSLAKDHGFQLVQE